MVNIDTVYEDTYRLIRNTVNSNVADPLTRSTTWVFASFPDTRKTSFPGYPVITIDVEVPTMNGMTVSKTLWNHSMIVSIGVYDTSAKRVDELSSLILKTIRTARDTFRYEKLHNTSVSAGTTYAMDRSGKNIHVRDIMVGFDFASS